MVRCPFSLARVVNVTGRGQVIYRAENPECRPFPKPASQYKDYVLSLLFIKYISDKFDGQPFLAMVKTVADQR